MCSIWGVDQHGIVHVHLFEQQTKKFWSLKREWDKWSACDDYVEDWIEEKPKTGVFCAKCLEILTRTIVER